MKKAFFLFLIFTLFFGFEVTARRQITLNQNGQLPGHSGIPFVPADMPDVYYDSDTEEIIIDGTGYATYYDVDIISVSTGYVVLYDTVNGNYGTVDVSSLPDDDYTILITSSNNNEYEGSFTKD